MAAYFSSVAAEKLLNQMLCIMHYTQSLYLTMFERTENINRRARVRFCSTYSTKNN